MVVMWGLRQMVEREKCILFCKPYFEIRMDLDLV